MRITNTVFLFLVFFLLFSCRTRNAQKPEASEPQLITRSYAVSVGDSFTIYVSLPQGYDGREPTKYPVVYLTDANFSFEMTAGVFRSYAAVGLIPQVILVGIGYRNIEEMDSLRDRDYTYPAALPEYEMQPSGGAERFLGFISGALIPEIEGAYHCDTAHRILMGHSLGGYFVVYALLQQLVKQHHCFSGFIAASPSLYYNHYYLLQQISALPLAKLHAGKLRLYITYGGFEDEEEADQPDIEPNKKTIARLSALFDSGKQGAVGLKIETFSNLAHMDMPIPSYLRGLPIVLDIGKPSQ